MGSAQSAPLPESKINEVPVTATKVTIEPSANDAPKKKKKKPKNLTGFQLVEYNCRKKRRAYDICHASKHKAFVGGKKLEDNEGDEVSCEDLFEEYKECIYHGMYQDRLKRGIKTPLTEESALGTYVAEQEDE